MTASALTDELLLRHEAGVFELTLNRPQTGNALTASLVEALLDALRAAESDGQTHTVLLRGAGRHFCTGFDLSNLDAHSDGDLLHRFVRIEMLLAALWHSPLRTAVLAHGRTWGAGADIVAACEVRGAMHQGSFRFPGAQFGLVLGSGRLARRVGPERARQWISSGQEIRAEDALSAGLTSITLTPDDLPPWQQGLSAAPRICAETARLVRAATQPDLRAQDMASLVESAARPGIQNRIRTYIQQSKQP